MDSVKRDKIEQIHSMGLSLTGNFWATPTGTEYEVSEQKPTYKFYRVFSDDVLFDADATKWEGYKPVR